MAQDHEAEPLSLRFRLRLATASSHRRLEEAISIEESCRDRDRYAGLLARFWGFYAPLEAALVRADWQGVGVDLEQRSKLAWLYADLTALGFSAERIGALPLAQSLPDIECSADVLGVLYVVEGSTLGGKTILPLVNKHLGFTDKAGARFFASYGPDIGANWRSYVMALERAGSAPAAAARIERAALRTFECLMNWTEPEPHSPKAQMAHQVRARPC